MGNTRTARARKLVASGRGHLLEGKAVALNDASPEARASGEISADAVVALKVRFGHQWLNKADVIDLARELAMRLDRDALYELENSILRKLQQFASEKEDPA
jgi:hypothetical protein